MSLELIQKRNALIIVTDSYAGNFEREMAAYMVGAQDEYMPGSWKEPADYAENCELYEDLFTGSFEDQFYSPVTMLIWPNNQAYHSVAILTAYEHNDFVKEFPEQYAKLIVRAKEFCKLKGIEFKSMHWMEITPSIKTTEVTL